MCSNCRDYEGPYDDGSDESRLDETVDKIALAWAPNPNDVVPNLSGEYIYSNKVKP